ncbi:MAG: hypothetical protein ACFE0P_00425 [Oceanicaulis sp.]
MRYDRMRALVTRRLASHGTDALLVWEIVTGGGTPSNPGTVTEVTAPVRAALVDYTVQERAGTSIATSDRKALVSAGDEAPNTSRKLRIDGRDWQIFHVRTIGPDGSAILHECQVR